VDVWLNTPEYPLEASGTSGEKAGINGVINLSVLDGWWGEGYNGENGWAITPHGTSVDPHSRDREEGQELLDILEKQVLPLYYERNGHGFSEAWVRKSKNSMKSLIPRFNAQRMVMDYVSNYYSLARKQHLVMAGNQHMRAKEVAYGDANSINPGRRCGCAAWTTRAPKSSRRCANDSRRRLPRRPGCG